MLVQTGQVVQNIQLQAASLELGYAPIINFDVAAVRRLCRLPRNLEPLHVLAVGYPLGRAVTPVSPEQPSTALKKAVLIVARENFHDEELFETRRALDAASVQTVIASARMGFAVGMAGNRAEVNVMVSRLSVDDYGAVVFLGGLGAIEYFENPAVLSIARQAVAKGKVVAAISIAPTILANAGVLTGKRATSFITERDRLQQAGAVYTGVPVQRDGSIITAVSPLAASQFGRAIADALAGR
jgi:protease I